jgi:hypothetical protein
LDYIIHCKIDKVLTERKNYYFDSFKNLFKNIKSDKLKENFVFFSQSSSTLLYLNLFNFEPILKKKIFYSNMIIREVLSSLFKFDFGILKEDVTHMISMISRTFRSILFIAYTPSVFISQSLQFCLGFLNFLKRFQKSSDITTKDAYELFFISGLGAIPITNFLQNHYKNSLISETARTTTKSKSFFSLHPKFSIVCFKSILDNYLFFLFYFKFVNFFEKSQNSLHKIREPENLKLFKDTCDSNPTLKRIEKIYVKEEPVIQDLNYIRSTIYTSILMAIFYTPIEFLTNLALNTEGSILSKRKLLFETNVEHPIFNRKILMMRLKNSFMMNLLTLYLKYSVVLVYTQYNLKEQTMRG